MNYSVVYHDDKHPMVFLRKLQKGKEKKYFSNQFQLQKKKFDEKN